jgi:7-keto-8-aminopelargonate synthetase-like enzyme
MSWLDWLLEQERRRDELGLRRTLRPRTPGEKTLDLAGNDYLGLARHPVLPSRQLNTVQVRARATATMPAPI